MWAPWSESRSVGRSVGRSGVKTNFLMILSALFGKIRRCSGRYIGQAWKGLLSRSSRSTGRATSRQTPKQSTKNQSTTSLYRALYWPIVRVFRGTRIICLALARSLVAGWLCVLCVFNPIHCSALRRPSPVGIFRWKSRANICIAFASALLWPWDFLVATCLATRRTASVPVSYVYRRRLTKKREEKGAVSCRMPFLGL